MVVLKLIKTQGELKCKRQDYISYFISSKLFPSVYLIIDSILQWRNFRDGAMRWKHFQYC